MKASPWLSNTKLRISELGSIDRAQCKLEHCSVDANYSRHLIMMWTPNSWLKTHVFQGLVALVYFDPTYIRLHPLHTNSKNIMLNSLQTRPVFKKKSSNLLSFDISPTC